MKKALSISSFFGFDSSKPKHATKYGPGFSLSVDTRSRYISTTPRPSPRNGAYDFPVNKKERDERGFFDRAFENACAIDEDYESL